MYNTYYNYPKLFVQLLLKLFKLENLISAFKIKILISLII